MENIQDLTFDTRDEFERKKNAERTISLLVEEIDVSPLVIDGGWGTGKTEFCYKLINLFKVKHSNYQQIYIDAFKADHVDQPLMTILAAILKALPDDERKATLIKKALPALRFGLKTGVKAGLSWLLRQDTDVLSDDFDKEVKKAGDKIIDSSVESLLKDHEKADESIASLQAVLKELAKEQPIIIYVDELDRCRPDFAVSMLESIKHVFDVPNVQFVLVTNSNQLRASIKHCYGQDVDAQRYLNKFIKFSFNLPEIYTVDGYNHSLSSISHYILLARESAILSDCRIDTASCQKLIETLITVNQLSLREVESFVKYLSIYHVVTGREGLNPNRDFGYRLLSILGVYLCCFEPKLSQEMSKGYVNAPAIMKLMGYTKFPDLKANPLIPHPSKVAIISAMVALESSVKDDGLIIGEEAVEKWDEFCDRSLSSSGFPPERRKRTELITQAVKALSLV